MLNEKPSEYILRTSREYAIYVCDQRAIPSVADGLKSGQRKMLWVIRNKNDKIKTISLAGESISMGLYLHGDQSASQTISLMAAPYCNNVPFLTGIGTFGTIINPYAWGAPRYTYVKKNKFTEEIMYKDIEIVPMKENYDGSTLEPVNFLPIIPTVLLNGISGIAVGWSTEILPRSLEDLIDAVIYVLDNKELKRIEPKYCYLNVETRHVENNTWDFYGKIERLDSYTIVVKSLPPELDIEKFRERLDILEEEDKISSYVDNSSEEINIQIKFKRGFLNQVSDDYLINMLKLKTRKTERIVVLNFDQNSIKQYSSAEDLIKDWVKWRLQFYFKRFERLLNFAEQELIYLNGLKNCFENKVIQLITNAKNKEEVISIIKNNTENLQQNQLEKIASLPTYSWSKDNYYSVLEKIEKEKEKIKNYRDILSSEEKIKDIFKREVYNLKKLKNNS